MNYQVEERLKKKILVTGGAGFIGLHTVVELWKAGFEPVILDNFSNSEHQMINRLEKIVGHPTTIIEVDLQNQNELEKALEGKYFDGVIHFAAFKAVGESVLNPLKYYRNNILGMVNILDWVQKNEVKNFLFSSSCTVYGEVNDESTVVDEESPSNNANSPYGQTKVIGEQMINDCFYANSTTNYLSLRYFNPIGAHPTGIIGELPLGKPNNLLPYVTQTALGIQNELVVFGNDYSTTDGTCVRDFIHVVDLAKAHVSGMNFLMKANSKTLEVINIGTGKGYSVLDVISTFESISGVKLNWKFGPRRPGDVVEIFANANKALDLLGWKAELSLEDAIKDAWNWEQKFRNEN